MESIATKTIFLAGATGTIGAATARLLHKSGARLIITGRNKEKLYQLADALSLPAEQVFEMDISMPEQVASVTAQCLQTIGTPDILINASGIGIIKPMENISNDDLQRTMSVNVMGPFYLIRALLPAMKAKGKGLLIHLPGVLGKTPMAGASAYAASKYALQGMLKSLREELKRTEIRITQVFLGGTDSAFWDGIDLRVQRDKMIMAEEAARSLWFLCQQPHSAVVSEMVLQPFNHQAI
jgi:NADP-dependent 3-hydroxy acid dehydrogenase YdfG